MTKKITALMLAFMLVLMVATGCSSTPAPDPSEEPSASEASNLDDTIDSDDEDDEEEVVIDLESKPITVKDSDGYDVEVISNPKCVAIWDYAILDILENIGFEKTGITLLVTPSKDSLPDDLQYFKDKPNHEVVDGGSLVTIDFDVLDLVQPELIIAGGRVYGSLVEDTSEEGRLHAQTEYGGKIVRLANNVNDSELYNTMSSNVEALGAIFPAIKAELDERMAEIKSEMDEVAAKAQASGKTALFCMTASATSLSVSNPNSRFDMLYEEFGFTAAVPDAEPSDDVHGYDVSAEYIRLANPDVIFVCDRSALLGQGPGFDTMMASPIIQQTTAYEEGHIYSLTAEAWYTMTGGFTAVERMIEDINQYFDSL